MNILSGFWRRVVNLVSSPSTAVVTITQEDKEQINRSAKPFKMEKYRHHLSRQSLNEDLKGAQKKNSHSNFEELMGSTMHQKNKTNERQQSTSQLLEPLSLNFPIQSFESGKQCKQLIKMYEQIGINVEQLLFDLIPTVQEDFESVKTSIQASILRIDQDREQFNRSLKYQNAETLLRKLNSKLHRYEVQYPRITVQELANVKYIFENFKSDNTQLPRVNPIEEVSFKSFCSLNKGKWLNDEVINSYLQMMRRELIQTDYKIMNTYFATKLNYSNIQRFISKNKLNPQQKLIIPVHWNQNHWMFVTIIQGDITLYDSMYNFNIPESLKQLSMRLHSKAEFSVEENYPKQKGYQDCGVFMLCGIKSICYERECWGFSQVNIYYKRLYIARDILRGAVGHIRLPEITGLETDETYMYQQSSEELKPCLLINDI